MKRLRCLALLLLVLTAGCAADGGPSGTGISAAISGNVIDVQNSTGGASADVAVELPPIVVSIDDFPGAATMADSDGTFTLSGDFAGSLTLRFTVPDFQVTQQLEVPAGSAVVLHDIELQPEGVVAQAVQQLEFFGTVDLVDCAGATLLVHERRATGRQYLVRVDDQTSFVDTHGRAQSCATIQAHSSVGVEGVIAYAADRTITALRITLAAAPPPHPAFMLDVSFRGSISAVDCAAGVVVIDDSHQRTRLQLNAMTRIADGAGSLACRQLRLGDPIRGDGQINLRKPGPITAATIAVTGPPRSTPLRFVGFVILVDCTRGTLQLRDVNSTIDVQLTQATVIVREGGQPLACADIQPGNRVEGLGQVSAGSPDVLQALTVSVRGRHGSHRGGRQ